MPPAGSSSTRRPSGAEVAVGVAASALRLGAGVGRLVLLPGRVFARSPFVEPALLGRAEELAAAGREAEARGRRQLEAAAGGILASPETARTLDRALTGTVPDALGDEAIETIARRLLESPAFERVLRDAAESPLARELLNDAVHSSEMQRAIEEMLAGPAVRNAVRNALRRETKTLSSEVADRLAKAAYRHDESAERVARRALGRPQRSVVVNPREPRYGGLASRGVGFLADAAITQLAALVVGALVGFVASSLGLSAPGWMVAALAGTSWTLFVAGYFVVFWTTVGQTPGMRVAGVRVTGSDRQPPGAWRSLVRFAGLLLALAPLGAGFVPVLFDSRRRALHDYLVRTVVVREASASP